MEKLSEEMRKHLEEVKNFWVSSAPAAPQTLDFASNFSNPGAAAAPQSNA